MLRGASFCPLIRWRGRIKSNRMRRFSHILSYALAAIIALTAQSGAVARMMPDATGQIVICTGSGPMMVYTDENGEPTSAPHVCPDCTMSLIVALTDQEKSLAATGDWSRETASSLVAGRIVVKFGTPSARGPPLMI